jgi:hypothetical protein
MEALQGVKTTRKLQGSAYPGIGGSALGGPESPSRHTIIDALRNINGPVAPAIAAFYRGSTACMSTSAA